LTAAAQNTTRLELFGGYTYTRIYNTNGDTAGSNGFTGDIAVYPLKWIGLVGDVGYGFSNGFVQSNGTSIFAPTHTLHYMGGPRVRFGRGRVTPYAEALFGAVHRSQLLTSEDTLLSNPQTAFAVLVAGGVDVKLARHFSIRLIQAGYQGASFTSVGGARTTNNDINLQTGFVIH
jgi:hypothetical protein